MLWYPLKLTAHIRTYAFGDRLIPEILKKRDLPEGVVAETWEISDYGNTTGTITNGFFAGKTLHELTLTHPDELVGQGWRGPHFPLLEKFLDASHALPVHLHADDETAAQIHHAPNGKTEAWHILWAAPGASILVGVKDTATREELFDAFVRQDYDSVMVRYPIETGYTIYVPGGTLHTFGPDCLVFEVQQTSDLGQMVMPTDLYDRPYSTAQWHANIQATLDELRPHHPVPHPGLAIRSGQNQRLIGAACPYFVLERWTLQEPHQEPAHPARFLTLSNVGQAIVQIESDGGTESLEPGESCLLPAAIGAVTLTPDGEAQLIACYVPDLEKDVVMPLRAEGYDDRQIQSLGQVSR